MAKNIGIWLDSDEAIIIENGKEGLNRISSEVEHFNPQGGAKGLRQEGSDTKLLHRKNNQLKSYFENIIKEVSSADKIVLFGPAETKIGLKKEIEQTAGLKGKLDGVETADNMSDNQLLEWVRNHFA